MFYPGMCFVSANIAVSDEMEQGWVRSVGSPVDDDTYGSEDIAPSRNIDLSHRLRQFPRRVASSPRQVTKFEKTVLFVGTFSSCSTSPLDCWNWKLQSFVCNHFQGYRTGQDL